MVMRLTQRELDHGGHINHTEGLKSYWSHQSHRRSWTILVISLTQRELDHIDPITDTDGVEYYW